MLLWALTVALVWLYPADAFSETPGQVATWDGVPVRVASAWPQEPSVFAQPPVERLEDAPPPAPAEPAVPGFEGHLSAGGQVGNRDAETALVPIARIDVRARLRIGSAEKWQPRLRVRAQFGGYPGEGVAITDPTTFTELAFSAGLFERVAPGLEVGAFGGVSALFKTGGVPPALEGPARWGIGALAYSDDGENWITVYLGQDQRLPRTPGWSGSACVGTEAGYRIHQEGRVDLTLVGELQRSLYSDGALVVRVGIVARVGSGS